MLTPTEAALAIADKHKMSADDQLGLIRFFGTCMTIEDFHRLAKIIDEELTAEAATVAPPVALPEKPPAAMTAGNGAAVITAFFDRDLARRALSRLVQLPSDGAVFERIGYDTTRLVVPKAEFATYQDILGRGMSFENRIAPHGEIVAGWYYHFADGSIGAIAIVNAATQDGGAFVDAFLILQEGMHTTVPNPSLPPRRRLDEDFVFPYPDGTFKVIRICPTLQ